jgi:nuclease S1
MKTKARRFTLSVVVLCLLLNLSQSRRAGAWGEEGHRIVAAIAELRLSQSTKAALKKLIGNQRISDEKIAMWADHLKGTHPETKKWHYVDIPLDATSFEPSRDCEDEDCVISKLEEFRDVLADKTASKSERQQALKFVVHFAGDIHQPLHCATRDDASGKSDNGGNGRKIHFLNHKKITNLHAIWDIDILDESLGDTPALSYAKELNGKISDDDAKKWEKGTFEEWAIEGHDLAKNNAYKDVAVGGQVVNIDAEYVEKDAPVVDKQLSRAGVRLAKILNDAFGTPNN